MISQASYSADLTLSTDRERLSPARVANHRLNHKLSSSSMSMSAPPLSPPFSDDPPTPPSGFNSLTPAGPGKPTPLGPSQSHNHLPPPHPLDPVPFPTTPTPFVKPEIGMAEYPFPSAAGPEPERAVTPVRRPARLSSGGEVLAVLARSISARSEAGAQPSRSDLDPEWLETKDREELSALLMAADAVIKDTKAQLDTVVEVGNALFVQNNQLKTNYKVLINKSHQPRHRSTLSQSSITSNSPEQQSRRHHLFSPVEPRIEIDRASTSPAGMFARPGAPRGADDRTLGSEPGSPTTSIRYNGIGLGPSSTARARITSASSVSSLFAPSPRTHVALSPTEVHALSQANYSLSAQLTELEAEADQKAQEGKKRLRKLEKEINGLRSELQRTSERNQALEETVTQVASQPSAAEAALDAAAAAQEEPAETMPRMSRRPSRNETLSALGMVSDFAPPFSPTKMGPFDTPSRRGRGVLGLSQRRGPSEFESSSDAVVAQLMAKIDELQKENHTIEEGRTEMEAKLGKAHEDVQLFKQRCEELEDEIVYNAQQPAIDWHPTNSTPGGSPVQAKGNRKEIEKRQRRVSEFGSHGLSRRSSGNMTLSASDKSLADSAEHDSPTSSPRFTSFVKKDRPPFRTGRTLESELGDHSYEENDFDLDTPQEDDHHHNPYAYHGDPDDSFDSSTATDFTADPAYRPASPSQTRVVSVYTGVRASHSYIRPGALRESGPPDEEQYNTIDRAATRQDLVWMDSVDPYIPPPEPTPRGLRHAFLESLDWARETRGDSDTEDGDLLQDGKYPTRAEAEEMAAMRERTGRLSYSNLRSRARSNKKKARRIGSGAPGEGDDEGLSRRAAAQRRLGLEASDAEYADRSDYSESDGEDRSCVSVVSEYDLLEGERPRQGDYWPVALTARYAPRMMVSRGVDAVWRQLVILLVYVRFYALLGLAVGFALWQGPDKTLGARRRIR